ncbi:hypothetical protein D1641_09550 [Colidextribacter sp. OB.20]|uniref:hypothetical protein n=1 Tax=Colidextribacter sp. OB.20 TaxID=2304568 RepID=UPI0013702D3F|nr:hypothetical protein [Colidextribacter sp. OB.20]NBI10252.1 hypothetical protein [Colidextribacter sp. OB.20]
MRSLKRNQQKISFRLYEGEEEVVNEFGNVTGEYYPIYGRLRHAWLCVSPNKGNSEVEQFGTLEDYDRTMTLGDTSIGPENGEAFAINENAVLWVDGAPTDGPWNYTVKRVAPWKNSISFAIKRVEVSIAQRDNEAWETAQRIKRLLQERDEV